MFRSVRGPAHAAIVLISVVALAQVATTMFGYSVYVRVRDGASAAEFTRLVAPGLVLSAVYVGLAIAAAVVFVIWLWRARENTLLVGSEDNHHHSRPWVIAGWFVPIVNFWFPRRVVADVWRGSAPTPQEGERLGLINGWWAAWVVMLVSERVISRMSRAAESPDELLLVTKLDVGYSVLTVIGAVLVSRVVLRITNWQSDTRTFLAPAVEVRPS